MADISEHVAAVEEPTEEQQIDAEVPDNGYAETENSNKRKLDEEAVDGDEDNDDGPAKKKTVVASADGSVEGVKASDASKENGVTGGDDNTPQEVIQCPRNMVGKLIGKEGSTIRDLQARSGAKIQIDHKGEGPNKNVTLIGNADQISLAKALINQCLDPDAGPLPDVERTIECPQGIVGRIIGKKGETIKALQSASNAHISVNQDFPEGEPRKIVIKGSADCVEKAVKMVNEVINGEPGSVQTIIQKYGETQTISCPKSLVGRIIGKQGETIKRLQNETGARIQVEQTSDPAKVKVSGRRPVVEMACSRIRAIINDVPFQGGQQFPPGGGMRPPFGGPGFTAPFPAPPAAFGGYGGYPPAGGAPPAYGAYGFGAPPVNPPQYPAYNPYGAPAAAADPYAAGYGAYQPPAAAGGYPAAAAAVAPAAPVSSAVWREERDGEGRPYYYNTKTGVSQWEKPAEMA